MHNVKRALSGALLITMLVLVFTVNFGVVHASTNVIGIIDTDTKWTAPNSPYTLTGPVGVRTGVTLTIEPGVTVNLGNHYILSNGTFHAQGTSDDPLYFNGVNAAIRLTQYNSGGIIENAVLASTGISANNSSLTLKDNSVDGDIRLTECSADISNNVIHGEISVYKGSASIANNIINGGISISGKKSSVTSNTITGDGDSCGIRADGNHISGNTISCFEIGIRASIGTVIEKNLIFNNTHGVYMHINADPTIRYNTITNNSYGITLPGYSGNLDLYGTSSFPSIITYHNIQVNNNNIYDNSNYNIYLDSAGAPAKDDVNAADNWWGTTDTQAISQTICDSEDDFNLGAVTFVPVLTQPHYLAPVLPSPPEPEPEPETEPESTVPQTATQNQSDSPPSIQDSNLTTTLTSTQDTSTTELYIIIGVIVLVTLAWVIYIFSLYRKRSSDTPV